MSTEGAFADTHRLVSGLNLHTVCQSARCPNIHECWGRGTATVMILGEVCTRACRFCAVKSGRPGEIDEGEPERVAQAALAMNLRHIVVTCVTRDDLPDGGAAVFADTIRGLRAVLPDLDIEVLTSDFGGSPEALETVLGAAPDVFSHNLETVRRLQPVIRPQSSYGRSLGVLKQAASRRPRQVVKSAVMVGLGETEAEVVETMTDLREVGCDLLAIGQYLQPTRRHAHVERYIEPGEFDRYAERARELGFAGVASGPMVRSSYRADELLAAARGKTAVTGAPNPAAADRGRSALPGVGQAR